MSMSLNQVILVGRVGKDPESKFTPNGTQIATFSLVTSEWNSKEKKEIPYIYCDAERSNQIKKKKK